MDNMKNDIVYNLDIEWDTWTQILQFHVTSAPLYNLTKDTFVQALFNKQFMEAGKNKPSFALVMLLAINSAAIKL